MKPDKETLEQLQSLICDGLSARKIAKIMGVSPSTITKWKIKYGLTYSDLRFKSTPAKLKLAQELINEGLSYSMIAIKVGVSRTTISDWVYNGLLTSKNKS